MKTLKKLLARVPASVRTEAKHVALTFAAAFIAAAAPLLPTILRSPSVGTAKAALIACVAAGARAAYPLLRTAIAKALIRIGLKAA